jgi:hypothetical protein
MSDLSVEKVQKTMDLIIKIAASITKMVPGDTDDRIVAVFEQFASQPWFAELVVTLVGTFSAEKPVSKEAAIKLFSDALSK